MSPNPTSSISKKLKFDVRDLWPLLVMKVLLKDRSPRKGNTFEKASFRGLTRSGRCYSITWKRLEGDSHPPTPLGPQPRAARPPSSRWPACPVPPGRILRAPQAPSAECHLTSGGHTLFSPPTSRRAWPPPSGQPTAPS